MYLYREEKKGERARHSANLEEKKFQLWKLKFLAEALAEDSKYKPTS